MLTSDRCSRTWLIYLTLFSLVLAWVGIAPRAFATSKISEICDRVAVHAAEETGVPVAVLRAITRTETGRSRDGQLQPWPWTVNMEGKGLWFDSREEAFSYVGREFQRGARSFDVGCFQINYKWHGPAFQSLNEMFDPLANARYAAGFLHDLYLEKGNWAGAAGAYHSRTPKHANRYKERFNKIMARLNDAPSALYFAPQSKEEPKKPRVRINNFPLLRSGQDPVAPGSLVSLDGERNPWFRL